MELQVYTIGSYVSGSQKVELLVSVVCVLDNDGVTSQRRSKYSVAMITVAMVTIVSCSLHQYQCWRGVCLVPDTALWRTYTGGKGPGILRLGLSHIVVVSLMTWSSAATAAPLIT